MNVATVSKLAPLFEKIGDLCKNVITAADSEKYAKGVHAFNNDVNEYCAAMRELVINDPEMPTEQKLEHLKSILEIEKKAKYESAEAIKNNREHVATVALVVLKAALTCGVSLAPEVIKGIKAEIGELPSDINYIAEKSEG